MTTQEAILSRRTIRKFRQDLIPRETLVSFVEAARMAPQGANLQPLKYCVVTDPKLVAGIFGHVRWAAYISPAGNPAPGEEPTAYILMLCDTQIKKDCDVDAGAAGATLHLAAHAAGVGACWMGAIDRPAITKLLNVPETLALHSLFALGYPAEAPMAEDAGDSIKYYKDSSGKLHVPKRTLGEVLFCDAMKKA